MPFHFSPLLKDNNIQSGLEMNIIVLAHRKVLVGERVEVTSRARVMSEAQVSVGP